MEQIDTATKVQTLTPQALATRMHISPKRLRQILRAEYPREAKNKRWEIPVTLTRRVERDYKAKLRERENKKQAHIKQELQGQE